MKTDRPIQMLEALFASTKLDHHFRLDRCIDLPLRTLKGCTRLRIVVSHNDEHLLAFSSSAYRLVALSRRRNPGFSRTVAFNCISLRLQPRRIWNPVARLLNNVYGLLFLGDIELSAFDCERLQLFCQALVGALGDG